ncbi:site-specific tyrosine recombinase XerC [Pedobacter glucosidilyticus]|nr:site-specific integrase [Pedobacter glucosidilyticus]KHJ36548.1 site-specific tyrosine recombinase XerC [Pedobacter glucosidilyticus]
MSNLISLHFFLKQPKTSFADLLPIYLRITVKGKRTEISLGRKCEPNKWSKKSERAIGNREETKKLNRYIDQFQAKVYEAQDMLIRNSESVTTDALRNIIAGKKEPSRTIIEVFKEHNDKVEALLNKEFAPGTLERYKTSLKHTQGFIEWKYGLKDLDILKIDNEFISNYEYYLRTVRNCANNSAVKYMKNFGKIIRICLANGWITMNPMLNYKVKLKPVERVFLSQEDLDILSQKEYLIERINLVRDIFLFSCYTGLAYADVKKLKQSEIVIGIDGELWIHTKRQKTNVASRIPLLPPAVAILNRYQGHPLCVANDVLLPVLSNQKMNAYLKEIADVCGIDKGLTYHIARHTFATTVTLLNDVPIETVSKMLGHSSIKMTQHYAKILDIKVGKDMANLRRKFS